MLTYSKAVSTLQALTGVLATDTTNTALLVQFWNDSRRTVAGINGGKWPWLETLEYVNTVANQEYVEIPNNIRRVISAYQQNGVLPTDVKYPLKLIFSQDIWDRILAQLLGGSNVPFFAYQRDTRLYIQPVPDTSGMRVYMRGRKKIVDLSLADYSTGSVITVTNGGTTVLGSSTSWSAGMAGMFIRLDNTINLVRGDEEWYEIASVTNNGSLELVKPYQGISVALGTITYTMGQITYEPEAYQMAPIYRAVAQYWDMKENMVLSERYWKLYDGGQEIGNASLVGGLIGQMLEESNESMEGPYISPTPRDGIARDQWPPYWFPYDLGTGM